MIILILMGLGVCLGSFVNALVWRVYKQEQYTANKLRSKYSITTGRSMCVDCGHELAPQDLVPLFSWFWLRGRCRYCHKPISLQYPTVELTTGILFAISYLYWPSGFEGYGAVQFCGWLLFLVGFMALAVYDLRWFILPNRIMYPLYGVAAAQLLAAFVLYSKGTSLLLGLLGGIVVGGGIFAVIYFVSRGKWIGFGDVRLGILLGALLASPVQAMLMIFISSVMGTFVALPLLVTGRAKQTTKLPFGPFLLASMVVVQLFGAGLVAWYKRQLGF